MIWASASLKHTFLHGSDMYQKEVRYLLAKLQEWDVTGEGKCSFEEIYQVCGERMGGVGGEPTRSFLKQTLWWLRIDGLRRLFSVAFAH